MQYRINFKPSAWYNEFHCHLQWKEYFSFYIKDFPIFAFRKYNWLGKKETSSYLFGLLGMSINVWEENKKKGKR